MRCDALIIGAGPAGLRCAHLLASHGLEVFVLERSDTIGRKVCAGGITWSGLIKSIPETLLERRFSSQTLRTRWQDVRVISEHTMIATINRQTLGGFLAEAALTAGAKILTGITLKKIEPSRVRFIRKGKWHDISFAFLVGADGSNSRVRSFLGLGSEKTGLGLNCMVDGDFNEMEWHFNSHRFGSGYAWIFPHKDRASFGAYCSEHSFSAKRLKRALQEWLKDQGIPFESVRIRAGMINCHFCGWNFSPTFLIGDAAGLASPLTGEGIFPAIVSAETVAETILGNAAQIGNIERLLIKRHKHEEMQRFASINPVVSHVLAELSAFLLKHRMITFEKFEMA